MTLAREARESDVEAIGAAHVAAIEAFGPESYDAEAVAAWAHTDEPPAERYDLDEGHYLVAELDGDVAGFGHLDPENCEVYAVYVHPDHTDREVESAVLAGLEGYARGAGCETVELTASLNAVDFYEHAGYESRRVTTHETSTGVELDCVRMETRL